MLAFFQTCLSQQKQTPKAAFSISDQLTRQVRSRIRQGHLRIRNHPPGASVTVPPIVPVLACD
jgi:hypothetical protein